MALQGGGAQVRGCPVRQRREMPALFSGNLMKLAPFLFPSKLQGLVHEKREMMEVTLHTRLWNPGGGRLLASQLSPDVVHISREGFRRNKTKKRGGGTKRRTSTDEGERR